MIYRVAVNSAALSERFYSIKSYADSSPDVTSNVLVGDQNFLLRKHVVALKKKLTEAEGGALRGYELGNCRGSLTVTCPSDISADDIWFNRASYTYEIELKETNLKDEERKNNE